MSKDDTEDELQRCRRAKINCNHKMFSCHWSESKEKEGEAEAVYG